ncbi:hypothetical protein COLO4_13403 [Corchorus olitorius]|uniref:Uncharacterized protein n=1 Tax=Corchorus olitorius TaxID=93759 RepID=A0A1R3JWM2_9ROSI|nr:hypothetical protein COLO4_13403 [Corchorus olitorius]
MEVHTRTPAIAKRLWKVLRITFFMIRKGLIAKRKLMMDMNLMMKRGKLLRKSLSNLINSHAHHHHHHSSSRRGSFGIQEYEFSCSNSPNPVFFHVHKQQRSKHHNYFPCINPPDVIDEDQLDDDPKAVVLLPKTPDYTFNFPVTAAADHINASDQFGSAEKLSPLLLSPFSVRVSNYSSEDDETDIAPNRSQVDDEAEEFIKRFYEQLRAQSRIQLLQYDQQG